jgi:Predicted rRNA methylase (SpoU class)
MLHVVLFEPEIPQNTGNIARTCAATRTALDLVHPLGFDISEKAVRHAGLDYWKDVAITEYASKAEFMEKHKSDSLYFYSTKARHAYTEITYPQDRDVYLIFGKESRGIDEEILLKNKERTVRLPMVGDTRSLNLSNSVAIGVYEYYRQSNFESFKILGELHHHSWEEAICQ